VDKQLSSLLRMRSLCIQSATPYSGNIQPYSEDRMALMMGGLHMEMAIQNMIGKWLAGSSWTDIFLKAGIATAGRCESLLKVSHVKRTRYAHEVSLAS